MNKYELLSIVSNQYTDDEVLKISEQVSSEITNAGGTVIKSQVIGKIRLAYPIKKQRHGTYVLNYFDAEPSSVETLSRKLKLTDELLRHTIIMRPANAQEKKFELTSYVAPLSEEAKETRRERPSAPRRERDVKPMSVPASAPSATSLQEKKMSIEELDQKLDELLKMDPSTEI